MTDVPGSLEGPAEVPAEVPVEVPVEGEWRVERIADTGVLADFPATVSFAADGSVAGSTGVNRFMGRYDLVGDAIEVGPLGMTRMAGPPEATEQEQRLVAALAAPLTVTADSTALLLTGAEGTVRLVPATDSSGTSDTSGASGDEL